MMEKQITLKEFLGKLKRNETVLSTIPMGLVAGLPIVQIRNKEVCLIVPYFRFVGSREADKSLVYPIKYTVKVLWSSGRVVGMEDLEYNQMFSKVDFKKPIGKFRHEAIKQFNAGQYREKRSELFSMYDKLINHLQDDTEFTEEDEASFSDLLSIILEPSLVPIYKALDPKFTGRFIHN